MAGIGSYDKKSPGNRGYKMKGSPMQRNYGIGSPAKQQYDTSHFLEKEQTGPFEGKKKQVPIQPGEMDGTAITGGSKSEEINDLEDRIEFVQSDISDSKDGKGTASQKAALAKLKARLAKMGG